jgi:hypothetical protein
MGKASYMQETIMYSVGGVVAALIASVVLLLLYRLVVGNGRPLARDAVGATIAVFGGVLAAKSFFVIPGNSFLAAIALMIGIYLVAMFAARRAAGFLAERSAASDFLPFGVAGLLGAVGSDWWRILMSA